MYSIAADSYGRASIIGPLVKVCFLYFAFKPIICILFWFFIFVSSRDFITSSPLQEHGKGGKCIVFTQTKRDADRLAFGLAKSYKCEALHGDISQAQRERTLAGFRDGNFSILVATDVAARGLDVPNVDLVSENYTFSCS